MNLFEAALEPVNLGRIDGAVGAARVAHRVQRDETHDPGVVDVVRESIVHVLRGETMPATAHMRVEELASRDGAALRVGRHLDRFTGHELLGMVGESFQRVRGVQSLRWRDGLAAGRHRRLERGCHEADPLAYLFVVAVATQPRNAKTLRGEWLYRLGEYAGPPGEPQHTLQQVGVLRSVRLPVDVARPVGSLHAVIPWGARVRAHRAAVEEGEEVRELVALCVVDRVPCHRHELWRFACQRSGTEVSDRAHRGRDRMRVQHLLRALHGEQLAKSRVVPVAVDELETRRRLRVRHVQVGDVDEASDGHASPCHVAWRRR